MTRKRFVKLCMANGYGRNAANLIAKGFNAKGKTYAEAYQVTIAVKKLCDRIIPVIGETVERVNKAISKVAKAASAAAAAFTEAFQAAMTEE